MDENLYINEKLTIPHEELIITTSRSSGPGGQHVNKTSSRVSLRWDISNSKVISDAQRASIFRHLKSRIVGEGELLIHVESERSQMRNRTIAKERLAELIREALEPRKRRIATKASPQAKRNRVKDKVLRGALKKLRTSKAARHEDHS